MKTALALLIGLLSISCSKTSPNLAAYYEALEHHDNQQEAQITQTIQAIKLVGTKAQFSTTAEATMFAIIQTLLLRDISYTPLDIDAPLTGYDYLSKVTVPVLGLAAPWIGAWFLGGEQDTGNNTYNLGEGSYMNYQPNSGNEGSYNSGKGGVSSSNSSTVTTTSTVP